MNQSNPEIGRTLDVDGLATNYHDHGEGPPVLLIHGSGPGVSAWANWRTVLPALSRHHRVIAPDIRGFGYTARPPQTPYGPELWLDHLLGFLDALELPKVSIVGNSFGGALALRLAAKAPERVDRLVLMGSVGVPFEITPGLEAVWGFEPSLPAMRELLRVFTYDHSKVDDGLAQLRLDAATRPGVQEAYASMFPAPRQSGVDALALDDSVIAGLPHETLILHGLDDQVIPLAGSVRLLELIERSQLHVFGQCGHWVQIEHGPRFVSLVEGFLLEAH
ncbi:alpha/beta fold hydrolase [Kribbella antibiotica]|uniref:Alpha/beta fold hydrolase n=1 Tax=Kribbella antibiotica TaxID=190195 RepID=A0A4R4ZS93_9ACTN|nr:alpha/beta hydrolase [Kribbella antibiotica]TDD61665.1 alpha/beta fold hydrolase [Kribbella antibiotica]